MRKNYYCDGRKDLTPCHSNFWLEVGGRPPTLSASPVSRQNICSRNCPTHQKMKFRILNFFLISLIYWFNWLLITSQPNRLSWKWPYILQREAQEIPIWYPCDHKVVSMLAMARQEWSLSGPKVVSEWFQSGHQFVIKWSLRGPKVSVIYNKRWHWV